MNEQQAFEIELRKELNKFFPDEFIPANFHLYGQRALQYQSLQSLHIGIETYEKLLLFLRGDLTQITFYEISFLINAIGSATPKQLLSDNDSELDYLIVQKEITILSQKWNQLVDPVKDRVRRKVNAFTLRGMDPINGKIIH